MLAPLQFNQPTQTRYSLYSRIKKQSNLSSGLRSFHYYLISSKLTWSLYLHKERPWRTSLQGRIPQYSLNSLNRTWNLHTQYLCPSFPQRVLRSVYRGNKKEKMGLHCWRS